jgi:hypothetical protein
MLTSDPLVLDMSKKSGNKSNDFLVYYTGSF